MRIGMSTNTVHVKALTLVLVFAAVCGTSAGNAVRPSMEQQTQQNPAIRTFNHELLTKYRELEDEIEAAKRQAIRRQKLERQEMVKRDEEAIERGAEELGEIRQAVITLRNDPWVRFVEVYVTMSGFSLTAPRSSRRTSVRQYDTWSRGTPRRTLAIIDRTNAGLILAQAEQAFRRIAQTKYLPAEIVDHHQRELEEYRMLEDNSLGKIKMLRLQAIQAIRALADQPDALKPEMAKWAEDIDQEIDAARKTLQKLIADYPAMRRAEPISFATRHPSGEFKSRAGGNVNLILVVRIRPEYFIPSVEEYQQLNMRSFNRVELVVLDSRLFRLVLRDGKSAPAVGFVEPDSWGGNVVFDSVGQSLPRSTRRRNHRCILEFEGTVPDTMDIQIGWLLNPKDAAGPFKLQFARFGLAAVPEKPIEPQASEDQSLETPSTQSIQ